MFSNEHPFLYHSKLSILILFLKFLKYSQIKTSYLNSYISPTYYPNFKITKFSIINTL